MITVVQIIIVLFALFAWSRALLRLRDKNVAVGEFLFWSMIWAGVIFLTIFPNVLISLSELVGIGRGVDIVIYFGMALLFYLMFRLYVKIDSQNKEITKLVRAISIMGAKDAKAGIKRESRKKK